MELQQLRLSCVGHWASQLSALLEWEAILHPRQHLGSSGGQV